MGVEALQRKLEVPLSEAGAHTGKSNIISASFLCSPSLGNVPSMRRGTYSYLISVYRMNGWMGGTMSPISSGAPRWDVWPERSLRLQAHSLPRAEILARMAEVQCLED